MESISKVGVVAIVAGALALGVLGGAIGHNVGFDKAASELKNVSEESFKAGYLKGQDEFEPQVIEKVNTVTEYVEVEPVEVMIDNGNLASVLDFIYEEDGNINYVLDDLDDDEVDAIVDRIVLVNDIKSMAVEQVKKDIADEVDKLEVTLGDGTVVRLDEDDVERIRIDDDYKDLVLTDVDFEDGDFTVEVTGRFEQDDVKFDFVAELSFKDGEFDEFKDVEVSERV